ncbi:ion channel [Ekhidna sp.]
MNKFYDWAYRNRFELFLSSQATILFGSLVVPLEIHQTTLSPLLFIINLATGILLISKNKPLTRFFISLFILSLVVFGSNFLDRATTFNRLEYIRLVIYFVFYATVTINIIGQVWKAQEVNKNVIFGLMSGYISLGLLGFFLFLSIQIIEPGSFNGILIEGADNGNMVDSLIYYSYITLLTIGYGEIYPVTPVAQKAAILVGLIGQFYLVIITAVVVEKYIQTRTFSESGYWTIATVLLVLASSRAALIEELPISYPSRYIND